MIPFVAQRSGETGAGNPGLRPLDIPALFATLYAVLSLSLVDVIPGLLILPVLLLLIPAWVLSRRMQSELYVRSWQIASALFIAGMLATYLLSGQSAVTTLTYICLFLILHRWFLGRNLLEHLELWALSALVMMVGALEGSGLFSLVVQAGWAISTVQLLNLLAVMRARPRRVARESSPYVFAHSSLRLIMPMLPLVFALALGLHFLMPRVKTAEWPEKERSSLSSLSRAVVKAGFSESVNLRSLTSIKETDAVAFRIVDAPADFTPGQVRFRMNTLDDFDGWEWRRSSFVREEADPVRVTPPDFQLPAPEDTTNIQVKSGREEVYLIRLRELPGNTVPVPENAIALGGMPPDVRVLMNADGRLIFDQPRPPLEYVVTTRRHPHDPRLMRGDVHPTHTEVHPRVREIARRAADEMMPSQSLSRLEKARALSTYLQRKGTYTLDLEFQNDGPAALRTFLEGRLEGHCELFATAMALVLRTEGIPSRLVTGFAGAEPATGEFSGEGGMDYFVRHRDAHAWVEVFDDEKGWVPFDPTPALPMTLMQERVPGGDITMALQHQAQMLTGLIENYDYRSQRRLWIRFRSDVKGAVTTWEHGALVNVWQRFRGNIFETPILLLAGGLFLLNLLAWFAYRRTPVFRRRPPTGPFASLKHRAPRLYADILKALGGPPPVRPGDSPRESILELARRRRLDPALSAELAELYNRWRYHGRAKELENQIRALLPRLRRNRQGVEY